MIFFLSFFACIFIVLANTTDVYHYTLTGVIFEMLWLPVLGLALLLPIYIIVLFVKNKFRFKPLHFVSLFAVVSALLFMYLTN
jgi:hypothetical protein